MDHVVDDEMNLAVALSMSTSSVAGQHGEDDDDAVAKLLQEEEDAKLARAISRQHDRGDFLPHPPSLGVVRGRDDEMVANQEAFVRRMRRRRFNERDDEIDDDEEYAPPQKPVRRRSRPSPPRAVAPPQSYYSWGGFRASAGRMFGGGGGGGASNDYHDDDEDYREHRNDDDYRSHRDDDDDYYHSHYGNELVHHHHLEHQEMTYEEMLALDENIVRVQRVSVNQLPKEFAWSLENGTQCVFCLEDLKVGDAVLSLPCLHHFHSHELRKWLKDGNAKCPTCFTEIQ
jgi:hypothetical protein